MEATQQAVAWRVTRRAFIAGVAALTVSPLVTGCRGGSEAEDGVTTSTGRRSRIDFPPVKESFLAVETALRRRRSVREFAAGPLTDAEIGQLLWAAQGVTADWGGRSAPSAGALYPLELHAVTASGSLHYLPVGHRAEVTTREDLRPDLMGAALDQEPVGAAPLVVAVVAVPARTAARYGSRARRYVDLEAGHAAQNLLLQAVALDLAAVPIGAFDDDAVAKILTLPAGHEPRYLIPVGHPRR